MHDQYARNTTIQISWVNAIVLQKKNILKKNFLLSKWDDDSSSFEIVFLLFSLTWAYIMILCEPAIRLTNQFEMFEEELGQCDWYSLSIELQGIYMIFLSDAQSQLHRQFGSFRISKSILKFKFFCWLSFSDYQHIVFIFYDNPSIQAISAYVNYRVFQIGR